METISVEEQAQRLALDNLQAEPDIEKVYWFPDEQQVLLLELMPTIPIALDGEVHPFYFRASPQDDLPAPSGIALIRPDEFGKLILPQSWGGWDRAILVGERR